MRRFKIKIKSTGLVFLGPILGAFVEEERKGFEKKKNSEQMTILAAGVFANIVFALIFYLLYVLFFFSSFEPVGYSFNTYGMTTIPLESVVGFEEYGNLTKVMTIDQSYYLDDLLETQLTEQINSGLLVVYTESPAVLLQIKGAISMADDIKILNEEDLRRFLDTKRPGDKIRLKTINKEGKEEEYSLNLAKNPNNESKAYLGVGYMGGLSKGFVQRFLGMFMSFKNPSTLYIPTWDGEFVYFIYHLFWWIMIINLLVALFNMLPLGMLDGGRFFYLTVLSLTKSKKVANSAYKFITYFILAIFLALMFFWFIRII
jgi:membrane-associated protease RseP (regulator of RpoE activity)